MVHPEPIAKEVSMKYYFRKDELYPVYWFSTNPEYADDWREAVEIPDSLIQEYERQYADFILLRNQIDDYCGKWLNLVY